jgi:hypothetical protein
VDLYIHSLTPLYGVVINYLSTGTAFYFYFSKYHYPADFHYAEMVFPCEVSTAVRRIDSIDNNTFELNFYIS